MFTQFQFFFTQNPYINLLCFTVLFGWWSLDRISLDQKCHFLLDQSLKTMITRSKVCFITRSKVLIIFVIFWHEIKSFMKCIQ